MCHSFAPKYRGLHVTLSGLDQNKRLTVIAWAIVPTENAAFYERAFDIWFGLKDSSGQPILRSWLNSPDHVQMSDRDKGIITMQKKLFPNALHFHCTKNIIDNCRKASTGKYHDGLVVRFVRSAGQKRPLGILSREFPERASIEAVFV
ncbi:MULE transposase domain [Perkinsela sp. CCAP 1560/4]|nr:MULE transposase domain [Perkinsela sp. CCAP 1560/4]|eukprot:KNH06901.1 MULE transposase domain [Perkinsela sp. CCAP 1560/4]